MKAEMRRSERSSEIASSASDSPYQSESASIRIDGFSITGVAGWVTGLLDAAADQPRAQPIPQQDRRQVERNDDPDQERGGGEDERSRGLHVRALEADVIDVEA